MNGIDLKRRRAIDCRLVRKSSTNHGYYKYIMTIQEKDGTTHEQPAYGKDMQDALSRLIWNERNEVVIGKLKRRAPVWMLTCWLGAIVIPSIWIDFDKVGPWILLITMGIPMFLFVMVAIWQGWLDKK